MNDPERPTNISDPMHRDTNTPSKPDANTEIITDLIAGLYRISLPR